MFKPLSITTFVLFLSITSAAGQGKFSGSMFGDYYYNIMRDTGALSQSASSSAASGPTAMQAFQFRRIYLTYDNDISEKFTTRFRLDVDQSANTSNGKIGSFVKDAYLRWREIFSGSDFIFGIQPTPAFEISEAAWGYRSLEKTILDLRGYVASRDFGISLKGKLIGDGMINYCVMLANNSGNSPETDKYKRYYVHLQLKLTANVQATLYADYKDAAKVTAGNNGTWTTAFFVGYAEPSLYSIGAEAFMVSQANAFMPTNCSIRQKNALGISLFGSFNITQDFEVVGRYDFFDPNISRTAIAHGDIRNYVITGLSWKVDKNVSIIPNLLFETYETPAGHGMPDPSITARVTLFYVFL